MPACVENDVVVITIGEHAVLRVAVVVSFLGI